MYSVKEIYYTLQGEGEHTGRAAVFLRFAGCNLWSGREADRPSAICQFCDTDFVGVDGSGGGKFNNAKALAAAAAARWPCCAKPSPPSEAKRGLPVSAHDNADQNWIAGSRQATTSLWDMTAQSSLAPVASIAPQYKARPYVVCTGGEPLLQLDAALIEALHARGFEVAVETNGTIAAPPGLDWICVSPKAGAALAQTWGSELKLVYPQPGAEPERFTALDFGHFFLQPMDGPNQKANIEAAADYCLANPRWRLSLQTHKMIGLP
jgi:7-carboxy-7-deazaguanine synthase (Cx14CxxC type)